MSYETRLVIGTEYPALPDDKARMISPIAEVDLSSAGHSTATGALLSASRTHSAVHYGFYAGNGDDVVTNSPRCRSTR